jgi:heme-degrading monooxygenase HmoA
MVHENKRKTPIMRMMKADDWEFVVIWQFQVRAGMLRRFEAACSPRGEWAKLFRKDKQYLRTELVRDLKAKRTYLTLDFWKSPQAYTRFRKQHAAEYEALDARCKALTESEREIGRYVKAVGKAAGSDGD